MYVESLAYYLRNGWKMAKTPTKSIKFTILFAFLGVLEGIMSGKKTPARGWEGHWRQHIIGLKWPQKAQ